MQDVCIKTSSLHRGKALHGSSEEFSSTLSRAGQPFSASMPLVESGSWKKQVLYNKFGSFGDAKTAIFDEIIGNQNQVSCIQTKYLMYFGIFSNLFGFGLLMSPAMFLRDEPRIPLHYFAVRLTVSLLKCSFWDDWTRHKFGCLEKILSKSCHHSDTLTLKYRQIYSWKLRLEHNINMHDMLAHTIIYPPAVWRLCRDLLCNSVWMTLTLHKLVWGEHLWEPGKIIIFFQSRRQRSIAWHKFMY